jgi:hypothetical protein
MTHIRTRPFHSLFTGFVVVAAALVVSAATVDPATAATPVDSERALARAGVLSGAASFTGLRRRAIDGVELTSGAGPLQIGLPTADTLSTATVLDGGTLLYRGKDRSTDFAVQSLTSGARALIIARSRRAPTW